MLLSSGCRLVVCRFGGWLVVLPRTYFKQSEPQRRLKFTDRLLTSQSGSFGPRGRLNVALSFRCFPPFGPFSFSEHRGRGPACAGDLDLFWTRSQLWADAVLVPTNPQSSLNVMQELVFFLSGWRQEASGRFNSRAASCSASLASPSASSPLVFAATINNRRCFAWWTLTQMK